MVALFEKRHTWHTKRIGGNSQSAIAKAMRLDFRRVKMSKPSTRPLANFTGDMPQDLIYARRRTLKKENEFKGVGYPYNTLAII
jgi:hypothetical protein